VYVARDGSSYNLNLIDTPGHVDFAYEVSRSLAACEGALLVVDASQGVEAQTVANCYTATEQGVTVVPVLNKIDLPSADPDRVITEIEDIIGIPAHDAILASAKTGEGVDDILEAVTLAARPGGAALPGFKNVKPQVFAGLYPVESNQYEALRNALDKLKLNDASLYYEPEVSQALGFGFRCGFLGLLHMDIVQERLEREYDMDLITTAPTVIYQVLLRDGTLLEIENPSKLPDLSRVEEIREPIITSTILMPQAYVGPVITLCTEQRGVQKNVQYLGRAIM